MQLRLGTDEHQAATGSADWLAAHRGFVGRLGRREAALLPFARGLGVFGARGKYPAGTGHAVPTGETVALCGASPVHLWSSDFNPKSRVVAACEKCVRLAARLG